ncbi:MAG: helix-turn-helix domain-containing protein, partial [Hyphomicrobium sp.]
MKQNLITLGKRLREARLRLGLSQVDIARRIGKSKQLISAWEAGRAEILSTTLADFARISSADANWLLLGIQNRNSDMADVVSLPVGAPVPLLCADEAIKLARGKLELARTERRIYSCYSHAGDAFALAITDDSMAPELSNGDVVIIAPGHAIAPGDIAAVVVRETEERLDTPMLVVRRVHYRSVAMGAAPFDLVPAAVGWPVVSIRKTAHAMVLGRVDAVFRKTD